MGFLPGNTGKPKGALNKRTKLSKPLKQWFDDKNIHPIDLIMETVREQKKLIDQLDNPVDRVKAWESIRKGITDLLPYISPKIKDIEPEPEAIDVTGEVDKLIEEASGEDLLKVFQQLKD